MSTGTSRPRPGPPERPRLRAKYDRRRDEIVAVAARLFAERGYRQTSIEDLVAATGLQRGGLYHYIDGKGELLLLIHDELMNPLLERAEAILDEGGDAETQLRTLVRAWVAHVATHRDHMTVFNEERRLIESDPGWARVRASRRSFQDVLTEVLRQGVNEGSFRIPDLELALLALLGMVNHMSQWLDPKGRLSPEAIADALVDLLLSGIAAPRAAPGGA
jgi:AcrR family transcriptional regulator